MTNQEIRTKAKESGVKLWEVAEAMGMSDCVFSRKLRHELTDGEKEAALTAIDRLAAKEGR